MMQTISKLRVGVCLLLAASVAGCVTYERWPTEHIEAVEADEIIPEDRLLDVGIHLFDPGLSREAEAPVEDEEDEPLVFPAVRQAEARFVPLQLERTLRETGNWGVVDILPTEERFFDVNVRGWIVQSDGAYLKLRVAVRDSTGRLWLDNEYESEVDPSSYEDNPRDPFQNVYNTIANDLLLARQELSSAEMLTIRRVTELRFAGDIAPEAYGSYLRDEDGLYTPDRLPAQGDLFYESVLRMRDREFLFLETMGGHYQNFYDGMEGPYNDWRRYSFEEAEAMREVQRQANLRKVMGVAALIGAAVVATQGADICGPSLDGLCRDMTPYAASLLLGGGIAAIKSAATKQNEIKLHIESMRELGESFDAEIEPAVVEVEGRTVELTGSAETQYERWRELLREIYRIDTGTGGESDLLRTSVVVDEME